MSVPKYVNDRALWCRWCREGDHRYHTDGPYCTQDNQFNADCRCPANQPTITYDN